LADQDWIGLMGLKNLRIRSGWDSISSDRTGLGLKNFTVYSYLVDTTIIAVCFAESCFL